MNDTGAREQSLAVVRDMPTLRVQALEMLRQAIIEGKFPPGSRLVERKLCDMLDVSRTVVREILRQLEAEGWVANRPYKGPTVATVSVDEARQMYEIRAALEGLAAKLCALRATDEQIGQLEESVRDMAAAARDRDLERQIRTIERFYEVLLDGAGNMMMNTYLTSQRSRLARLRSLSLSRPERALISVDEKVRIAAAIKARDPDLALKAAEFHVQAAAKAAFDDRPSSATPAEKPEKPRKAKAGGRSSSTAAKPAGRKRPAKRA